ncbi:MAG: hypothetical protein WCN88_01885 [Candidatus Falkowbacteria bacterium]
MKNDVTVSVAKTIIIVTGIIFLFVYLGQSATHNGQILLNFFGPFLALLYVGGITFRKTYVWEVRTGRIVAHMSGPVSKSNRVLASSWILWFFFVIMTIFVVSGLLSMSDRYDVWIGTFWEPLRIVSGLPSFFSSLALLFILLFSWFARDEYCYRPVSDTLPEPA